MIMKILNTILTLYLCLSSMLFFLPKSDAQDYNNVLPLHTGKSYILDFPVKVTRVVGGDPSAMELNLFKKDISNGEIPGYQLLIAPIAEKNTNIIVWTEIGMYVFDVDIDNSSPYTSETIVSVPKIKRFTIPLTESSNSKTIPENLNKNNQLAISSSTGDIIENPNPNLQNNNIENNDPLQKNDYLDVLQQNKNLDSSKTNNINLDSPPNPENKENKKKKRFSFFSSSKKEDKKPENKPNNISKNNEEISLKKDEIKQSTPKTEKNSKPIKVDLKPQIPITVNSTIKKSNNNTEEVISLTKQEKTQKNISKDENKIANTIPSSPTNKPTINKIPPLPLKLSINKISKFEDKIILNISLQNNSSEPKYVLWDLTKVIDQTGNSFYVKNLNLPPGILYPSQSLTGDIAALARPTEKSQMLSSKQIKISIFGSQGQLLINSDISVK